MLGEASDLEIVWVMADNQVNDRTRAFIGESGLDDRIHFLMDRGSRDIDRLGLRRPDPEPIEVGVPHPATYLIDRDGVVRFADVREDFRIWLDPGLLEQQLAELR